jgi:hypothetical protein
MRGRTETASNGILDRSLDQQNRGQTPHRDARQRQLRSEFRNHPVVFRSINERRVRSAIVNMNSLLAFFVRSSGVYACEYEWEKRGKVRDNNAVWHARIMSFMAGAEAEAVLLGKMAAGDGVDKRDIYLMLAEVAPEDRRDKLEARLRRFTRMLVRRHAARIKRVANALFKEVSHAEPEHCKSCCCWWSARSPPHRPP